MKHRAYNKVILPDGTMHLQHVVVTDADGCVADHYPLTAELPFIEWIGGTLDLR